MYVGALRITLRLFDCHSLKQKRAPRQRLVARIRNRWSLSVAEVDDQDTLNLITLGVSAVGPAYVPVERVLQQVARFVADAGDGRVIQEDLSVEQW